MERIFAVAKIRHFIFSFLFSMFYVLCFMLYDMWELYLLTAGGCTHIRHCFLELAPPALSGRNQFLN